MRRSARALLMVFVLVFQAGAQTGTIPPPSSSGVGITPQIPCSPPPKGVDPAMPMNQPDRFMWQIFVDVNKKAPAQFQHTITAGGKTFTTNSAVWETWPDDPYTFPSDPDPANPPKWPDAPLGKELLVKGKGSPGFHSAARARGASDDNFILDTGGEEIHRNRATFDYVIQNNLWYQQGVAAFVATGQPINFPTDSVEVKGNWVKISEAQKSQYHWNYDKQGVLWGLVAMHITSKAIPNWIWATFEWVDNPGRCDYIGCRDCFGSIPSYIPSNNCPPKGDCPESAVGQVYAGGSLTPALQELFTRAGYTGDWLGQYLNYRLKGSQTDFTAPTGEPLLVANSVTESFFLQTASCMTCHSRAAVDNAGNSAFPIFGEKVLPLQPATPGKFQIQQTTHNGAPDPNWFTNYTGLGPVKIYTQTDFVWAIPFRVKPAKTTTATNK
jgi:hypothetical protein